MQGSYFLNNKRISAFRPGVHTWRKEKGCGGRVLFAPIENIRKIAHVARGSGWKFFFGIVARE
jgi:hypothetical protein